ncbi:MAG: uracil-DNA glycosylase [Clostridia bacterium]
MLQMAAGLAHLQKECAAFFKQIYVGEDRVLVFGEGEIPARLMLIGEAPGEQEALQRRPFVGKAGKNLDQFLACVGLERKQLYITNAVKFRPTRQSAAGRTVNRTPTSEEIALWRPWLLREIALVRPQIVATLGNVPLRALTGKSMTIGEVHGTFLDPSDWSARVFPLYHPASVIYRPALQQVYVQDVARLAEALRRDDI